MAKKTKKAKALSFRQRLRQDAEAKLAIMLSELGRSAQEVCDETSISEIDLMGLACGTQTKTLREHLITQLANDKEAELEEIYNTQNDLPLDEEKPDADQKEA